jgi:AcrR family transcriptional regulator
MKHKQKHLLRRKPTQARGQVRVQRILDAAAQVIEEVGYDAATTNAIARRARTSIGSLYQFFPNKAALINALALQYTKELSELLGKVLGELNAEGLTWQQIIGRIVDAFAHFHRTRAGFQAIWFGGHLSAELITTAYLCGRDIALSAEPLLALVAPDMPPARRTLVARVATEIVGAMLIVSTLEKRHDYIEEAKRAVVAYIERSIAEP